MKYLPQNHHSLLRKAVVGSFAVHLVGVAVLFTCSIFGGSPDRNEQPTINTRITDVSLRLDREESPTHSSLEIGPSEKAAELPQPQQSGYSQSMPLPMVRHSPGQLPPEMIAIIKRSRDPSPPGETGPAQQADRSIRPAGAEAISTGALPLHGAMKPEQSIVYILDCSGSMGEFGKFDVARASLLATLSRQPATLHFQVIPYNNTARPKPD
jgi:hypothetical protein